jgi:hypothetical protein
MYPRKQAARRLKSERFGPIWNGCCQLAQENFDE